MQLAASSNFWTSIDPGTWVNIGTGVIAFLALVASIIVFRVQQRLAKRQQLFPITGELLTEFRTPEFRERLAYIREHVVNDCPAHADGRPVLSDAAWAKVGPVMSYFNNVGFLVANGAVAPEVPSSIMGGSVVEAWEVLGPFIYAQRIRRDGDPNYFGYFEHLARAVTDLPPDKLAERLHLDKLPPPVAAHWPLTLHDPPTGP